MWPADFGGIPTGHERTKPRAEEKNAYLVELEIRSVQ
jgi:hypothetical protein